MVLLLCRLIIKLGLDDHIAPCRIRTLIDAELVVRVGLGYLPDDDVVADLVRRVGGVSQDAEDDVVDIGVLGDSDWIITCRPDRGAIHTAADGYAHAALAAAAIVAVHTVRSDYLKIDCRSGKLERV